MVARRQINNAYFFFYTHLAPQLINSWKRNPIFYGSLIPGPVVYAHLWLTGRFGNEWNQTFPESFANPDEFFSME